MIEIRTYDGDARELVDFASAAWSARASGLPHAPRWSETSFEWQLLSNPTADPYYRVAAYDGRRLVGTLFAEELSFRCLGTTTRGTLASWLTVDPEYRRRGIAGMLTEALRRRHRERQASFCLGFGLRGSGGAKFWARQPDTLLPGRVGFWVRILDRAAVASWATSLRDRVGAHVLRLWAGSLDGASDGDDLGRLGDEDFPSCLTLCNSPSGAADLAIVWTPERLQHQLCFGEAVRTYVLRRNGGVAGIASYHLLAFTGREERSMAIFDVVELDSSSSYRDGARLLRRALHDAREAGACSALVLRQPRAPKLALAAAGFVPLPPDFDWILTFAADRERLQDVRRIHALWR